MENRNTLVRTLHDLGAAAWFGGTLMGAIGLNGAAGTVSDETERAAVASAGWGRWAPFNALAIGAHLVGGAGLVVANRDRVVDQEGTRGNTIVKLVLTGLALALTAYSGVLGATVGKAGKVPAKGSVTPSASTPSEVAGAMKQLKLVQFAIPAVAGSLIVLGAQQGEQQKPEEQLRDRGRFGRRR